MLAVTEAVTRFDSHFWVNILILASIGLILTGLAVRAVNVMAKRLKLGPLAIRPVQFCVRWLGIIIVTSVILHQFQVDLYNMVTAILAMVAIGFVAVWSVLSNISCTFLLLVFKPFRILDEIEFPGEPIKGRVVDLSLLYTTLKTEEGDLIQIPNNLFFQKVIKRREGSGKVDLEEQLQQDKPAE